MNDNENYNVFNSSHQWQDSFRTFHDAVAYIRMHIRDLGKELWSIEDEDGHELRFTLNG